jgi:signal transduction histidine kinase
MKQLRLICFFILLLPQAFSQNKNIDSLRIALEQAEGKNKIKTLLELCWEYRFVNADTARQFGLQALELAKQERAEDLETEALHRVGVTHEAQGNYKEALTYELQALSLGKKIGDPLKIANTLNNLGIINDELGDYEKALAYYFEARKIYETLKEESKVAMVLTNVGIVLKAQKEYKNGVQNYREALAIYQRLGNKFGQASCHANLGSVYLFVPNYDSALHYSLLASAEFEKQNIRQFLPITWSNAAKAYQKLGQPTKAKELFLKAKELHTQYDNKKELSFTSIQLALLENELGNTSNALKFANNGLTGALSIKALEQIMQAHEALATIHATSKNYQTAWQEHQLYVMYKDSLFQQEKAKQLLTLQLKFETEKKDNQITQLNKDNQIKSATIERNYFFVGGLGVILSLSFFFYRYREKQKQKAVAQEQKVRLREAQINAVIDSQERERKRFASDLHDGMGQLVSALQLNIQSIKQNQELEKTVSLVDNSEQLLNDIQTEIRNIAFNLMPAILVKEGLLLAVRELTRRISKASSIQIELAIHDVPDRLPDVVEVSVYRIIQELLGNIIKHSKASQITLSFTGYPQEVVLTVEDNGDGFDLNKFQQSENSNGWRTIQTRINLIKGEIEFDTMAGRKNSTVIINIPLTLTAHEPVLKNT